MKRQMQFHLDMAFNGVTREMHKAFSVSVVIPVYNGKKTIEKLFHLLRQTLENRDLFFEVIFVEDCGRDDAWDVIMSLVAEDERVRGFKLSKNFGQHNALLCGIRGAKGDVIVTLDDDLQNPPEEIPGLLAKLEEGYDVVYGTPKQETHGILRDLASTITKLALNRAMGAETASKISAFRAFRTDLRKSFEQYQCPLVNIDVLLTWGTDKFAVVDVRQDKRMSGKSGYTMQKLIRHAFNMMTGFTTIPLQIASYAGFFFSLFGAGILVYVVLRYVIEGTSVPGFPFLASIIAIFSGIQLFTLGIIGEYLARMHFRTMDQPPYVVHCETNCLIMDKTKNAK